LLGSKWFLACNWLALTPLWVLPIVTHCCRPYIATTIYLPLLSNGTCAVTVTFACMGAVPTNSLR
jgi:hypothetical protein